MTKDRKKAACQNAPQSIFRRKDVQTIGFSAKMEIDMFINMLKRGLGALI